MESSNVLEVNHLSISFRSVKALEDVSLKVRTGEIHALLGQNGAGKTTLMWVLGGLYPAKMYQGEIVVAGQPVVLRAPNEAVRNGIAVVSRHLSVFANLSVAENICMGQWQGSGAFLVNREATLRQAEGVLRMLGVTLDLGARVSQLDPSQKRLVAIARAMSSRPRLVILDEPASYTTTSGEVSQLIRILRLLASQNIASLYLSQNPEEVMQIADRITVLRDGTVVETFERTGYDMTALALAMLSRQPGRPPGLDEDPSSDGVGGIFRMFRFLGSNSRR